MKKKLTGAARSKKVIEAVKLVERAAILLDGITTDENPLQQHNVRARIFADSLRGFSDFLLSREVHP